MVPRSWARGAGLDRGAPAGSQEQPGARDGRRDGDPAGPPDGRPHRRRQGAAHAPGLSTCHASSTITRRASRAMAGRAQSPRNGSPAGSVPARRVTFKPGPPRRRTWPHGPCLHDGPVSPWRLGSARRGRLHPRWHQGSGPDVRRRSGHRRSATDPVPTPRRHAWPVGSTSEIARSPPSTPSSTSLTDTSHITKGDRASHGPGGVARQRSRRHQ